MAAIGMAAAADLDALAQRTGHGFEQIAQDTIAAGERYCFMKSDVEVVEAPVGGGVVGHGRLGIVAHPLQGILDGSNAGPIGALGGQRGALNLKRKTHFDEIKKTLGIIVQQGCQEIGKGSAIGLLDDGALALGEFEQAPAGQELDGLADCQAADGKALGQLRLAGQAGAGRQFSEDFIGQVIGNGACRAGLIRPGLSGGNRNSPKGI